MGKLPKTYSCAHCKRFTCEWICTQCWDLVGEAIDLFHSSNEVRRNEVRSKAKVLIVEVERRGGSANSWRTTFGLKVK